MMRVAVGGIYHESNSFFSQSMTMAGFLQGQYHVGADIIPNWTGTGSEMAGFLEAASRFDFEVVPTVMAYGVPSGTVTAETFEELTQELLSRLRLAGPLDGVLLSLHGAMVSERHADADGEILSRVRELVGEVVPVLATVDCHANLTRRMLRFADVIVGYKTYPHIDQKERGLEAGTILNRMLREGLRPKMEMRRRPLLPHILRQATERPPMSEIMSEAQVCERTAGVISISVIDGFAYTDVPESGFAVLVVGEESEAAGTVAEQLAERVWQRRSEFRCELSNSGEAVTSAMSEPRGPVVLVNVGDNVGAGTPGDGTVLLAELLRQGARGALVLLCDADAVAECEKAGVRKRVTVKVGAKQDTLHGAPVEISGTVRLLSDGIFTNVGPMREGIVEDQGRTAVVNTGGVLVVLTERRQPMWNLEQLHSLGIEPSRLQIVVVKAAIAYRAAYLPIAAKIIEVDTPGLSAADIRRFHYVHLDRPMYPLDAF